MTSSSRGRGPARTFAYICLVAMALGLIFWGAQPSQASTAQSFGLHQTIYHPDPEASDSFGQSVAWVGADALIGVPNDDVDLISNAGTAYLFSNTGTQLAVFTSSVPVTNANLGSSVAPFGDHVLLGAPGDTVSATTKAGAVYVFDNTGAPIRTIENPSPASFENFGRAVAEAGPWVLIGAPNVGSVNGEAYIYDGATGTLSTTIPSTTSGAQWGLAVAGTGAEVLVAAPLDTVTGTISGIVRQFDGAGNLQREYFKASPVFGDQFGFSVASFGSYVLIGIPFDDTLGSDAGAAYLYDAATGALLREFYPPGATADGDNFGSAVAGYDDYVLIGAPQAEVISGAITVTAGAAYLFSASTGAELETFTGPNPVAGDSFGKSVAATLDYFLIGAPSYDLPGASGAGAVYIFGPVVATPTPTAPPTQPGVYLPLIYKPDP